LIFGLKFTPAAGGKVLYRPLELLYRPLQLLQRVVKYFTASWSLERVVKCYFAARQNRKNRHVKKKPGRQIDFVAFHSLTYSDVATGL
jgi:hypothetical protein